MERSGMKNLFVKNKKEILRYAHNDIKGKAQSDMEMA
jgi:hypothetical protein